MRIYRTTRNSVRALRRNIMRSILTTLGIVIGVAAVIVIMEVGNGTSAQMQKRIASLGANNLQVIPGSAMTGGINYGAGSSMTLTPQDCDAIIRDCTAVRGAAPLVRANGTVVYGNNNTLPATIWGTTADYLAVRQWDLDEGLSFTDQDVRNAGNVCLLGLTTVAQLFGREDPIGKEVRLANVNLRVVGVLGRKGANMFGQDQDDVLIAPWRTIKFRINASGQTSPQPQYTQNSTATISNATVNSLANLYPNTAPQLYPAQSPTQQADTPQPVRFTTVNQIICAAGSTAEVHLAIDQISDLLRERHHLRNDQDDDFTIRDMTEVVNVFASNAKTMAILLLIVACVSLVVGGVGIMNIMLVSVTERTREIGLRMAVGARARDILVQFLLEAIMLCLAGGAIGIVFGRSISMGVEHFMHWPIAVSFVAIAISVIVSASVGLIFGFYPAWKASNLDPIEALRYE